MQRKQNPRLANRHHAVIGMSGSGKSTWLNRNKELAKATRVIAWDPDHDHVEALQLQGCDKLTDLMDAVIAAGTGPLRVAYTGTPTRDQFVRFLQILRAAASADRVTVVVLEEMSSVVPPQWQDENWVWLWTGSRKYGLVVWGVTHSPLSVDKLPFRQAMFKWFGGLQDPSDIAQVAKMAGLPQKDLANVSLAPDGKSSTFLYGRSGGYKLQTLRF